MPRERLVALTCQVRTIKSSRSISKMRLECGMHPTDDLAFLDTTGNRMLYYG